MTQEEAVIARLKRGPLTSMQAIRELGITRLAARVATLRARGHKIVSTRKMVQSRYSRPTRIAIYTLA
jgi:hypothetical protein